MIACMFSGLDSSGIIGQILHYAIIFAMMGMAALVFFYLWREKRLDMDESPKHQMLDDDDKPK